MSLPAALTWLQLLPHGTTFSCATGPAWLQEMLRERAGAGGAKGGAKGGALVMWGKPWAEVAVDLPQWGAVVAVNCSHVTMARLESAGYAYARRFAVLPSLEKARWFISLDSGRAAAASFSLYTPSRNSAHVKKAVARMLAKLRVPGWYRDEIIVASRQPPPLERKLAELFPQEIRLALSSGAPEPAINRKPSAAVIDAHGKVLAFVKIAVSGVSRAIVAHEAEMLIALADLRRLDLSTPRLLFAGEVDGRFVTVQRALPGRPAPAAMTREHEAFLLELRCGPRKTAAETNMVATLPQRLDAVRPSRPDLRDLFGRFLPTLEQTRVTSTLVHGDFAPWNLRTHRGKLAAFDWEYGEIDGLPLIDHTHYTLQLGYLLHKWDVGRASRCLAEMALSAPNGMTPEQVRSMHAVYLLDQLARLLGEGYARDHQMVSWLEKLLRDVPAPAPALATQAEVAIA